MTLKVSFGTLSYRCPTYATVGSWARSRLLVRAKSFGCTGEKYVSLRSFSAIKLGLLLGSLRKASSFKCAKDFKKTCGTGLSNVLSSLIGVELRKVLYLFLSFSLLLCFWKSRFVQTDQAKPEKNHILWFFEKIVKNSRFFREFFHDFGRRHFWYFLVSFLTPKRKILWF